METRKILAALAIGSMLVALGLAILGGMILGELRRNNAPTAVTKVVESAETGKKIDFITGTLETVAENTVLDVNMNTDQRIDEVLAKLGEIAKQPRNYTVVRQYVHERKKPRRNAQRRSKPEKPKEEPKPIVEAVPEPPKPTAKALIDYDPSTRSVYAK